MWAGWVHHSWRFGCVEAVHKVGPEMPECGSKLSMVPVVLATFGTFSVQSKWFPVGRDWWPWTKPGYITMTRRKDNNQWSGGIAAHPAPKYSECKNPLEKFSPQFFGIKTASSSMIIFQRTTLTTQSITHLCWCKWRPFWRKNTAGWEGHQGGLVLAWQCPGSPGACNPEETGLPGLPMTWSLTLFSGSGPVRLLPVSWTKKQLKGCHFLSDMVIAAVENWLDGQLSEFFLVACKS